MSPDYRIIYYQTEAPFNGVLAIIVPSPHFSGTPEELARKTVPSGHEYRIIDKSKFPESREYRGIWDFDFNDTSDSAKVFIDPVRKAEVDLIRSQPTEIQVLQNEVNSLKSRVSALEAVIPSPVRL